MTKITTRRARYGQYVNRVALLMVAPISEDELTEALRALDARYADVIARPLVKPADEMQEAA